MNLILLKLYFRNYWTLFKKSYSLLKLLSKIFYRFITKDYLNQYPVESQLYDAFEDIDLRARPLTKQTVEMFERFAFAPRIKLSKIEDPIQYTDFYYDETSEKKEKNNE